MVILQHDRNDQYKITLPKTLVEAKGWKKGDSLTILISATGDLLLKPKKPGETDEPAD